MARLTWSGRGRQGRRVMLVTLGLAGFALPAAAQRGGVTVAGHLTVLDQGNKSASDVGTAVIWLEGAGAPAAPAKAVQVIAEEKEFRPRVSVVPVGSSVTFPNNDPFNHNVFSPSPEGPPFDLGLYQRGQPANSWKFDHPGIIHVYCNVHPQMAAFIIVRDNPYYTQPAGDGGFEISGVKPGSYTLHAWHERAGETSKDIQVGPGGVQNATIDLDARGYKFVQHLNKFGRPYPRGGVRY